MNGIPPILVVDDDADTRTAIRAILEANAFAVVESKNGRSALHYLTSDAPEPCLILLDLGMPEMSGTELLDLLMGYSRLAMIPVVIVSGHDPQRHAPPPGSYAHYLRKPFTIEALLKAVNKFRRAVPIRVVE